MEIAADGDLANVLACVLSFLAAAISSAAGGGGGGGSLSAPSRGPVPGRRLCSRGSCSGHSLVLDEVRRPLHNRSSGTQTNRILRLRHQILFQRRAGYTRIASRRLSGSCYADRSLEWALRHWGTACFLIPFSSILECLQK